MTECPFCRSVESTVQPYHEESFMPDRNTEAKYRVICITCFAEGPPSRTPEMAEKKWDGLLFNIKGESKFKEAINEASYAKNPRDMFWYAWEAFAGNVYDEDERGIDELMRRTYSLGPEHISEPEDLWDIVANIQFADGPIAEEDVHIFAETLFKYLKMGEFVNEMDGGGAPAGGVSAPMATLTNTPGMGNATPAPSAGLNTDGPSGSGDKWGDDEKPKKKKKKINLQESYDFMDNIDPEYTGKQYVGYNNRRWEVIDYRRHRDPEVLINPLLNPYKNGPASMSNARIGPVWVAVNQLDDDVNEMNTNPYDKIASMMSKKMGVKQPFKKKDSKTNTIKQHTIDEISGTKNSFNIQTLDSYEKAAELVPRHPLQGKKKKTKKVNEEISETPAQEESNKNLDAKNELADLGIPYIYKEAQSGRMRVYLKMNVNKAIELLEENEWEEVDVNNNPANTVKMFHKGDSELAVYTNNQKLPMVTMSPIKIKDDEDGVIDATESNESIKPLRKLISNTLEPYMKEK